MSHPGRNTDRSPAPLCLLGAGLLVWLATAGGCSKPLLSPADERSQYDRYDAVRSQYASQYTEDEFGRRRPNLRGRLSPKD